MTVRNALDNVFKEAHQRGEGVLIPYLTAGFPDRDRFVDLATAVLDAGADVLEIGVPFSDPLLDGPSIQRSQQTALDAGISPRDCLQYAAEIHARSAKPLLFMGAYNPILAHGLDRFCEKASAAGITGMIVPDLPFEEQDEIRAAATPCGLHVIQLLAPTSSDERVRTIASAATGFIYCISVAGVTGARAAVGDGARHLVERVHAATETPAAVGFGISDPEQARTVTGYAEGAIVGSALIDVVASAADPVPSAREFIGRLADAVHAGTVPA